MDGRTLMPIWLLSGWGFVKRNWQLFAILAAAIAIFIFIQHIKHEAYNKGKADCNAAWNKRVQAEDKANRKFEAELQKQVDDFAKRFAEAQAAKDAKETEHVKTIKQIVEKPIYKQ